MLIFLAMPRLMNYMAMYQISIELSLTDKLKRYTEKIKTFANPIGILALRQQKSPFKYLHHIYVQISLFFFFFVKCHLSKNI